MKGAFFRRRAIVCCVFVLGIGVVEGQEKGDPLADLQNAFEAQLDLLDRSGSANTPIDGYVKALEDLQKEIQQTGDLDRVIAIRDERTRVLRTPIPAPKLSEYPALAKLQEEFQKTYGAQRDAILARRAEVTQLYREKLTELLKNYSGASNEDGVRRVLAVYSEIDAISGGGPLGFRGRLSNEEFIVRFAAARETLHLDEVKQDGRSPYGLAVTSVDDGGVAADLGIKPGDRIIRVGRQDFWYERVDWKPEERARTLVWETSDGSEMSRQIGPGKIGVTSEGDAALYRYYLGSPKRSAVWDELMLVAILMAESEPELAESSMSKAITAGYAADSLSSVVGVLLAIRENRPADALAFAKHIESEAGGKPENISPALYPAYFRAFLASGQLDALENADAARDHVFSGLRAELWPDFLADWQTVRKDWNVQNRPSTKTAEVSRQDVFARRRLLTDFYSSSRPVFDYPKSGKFGDSFEVESGHYRPALHAVDGGIENCLWEIEFAAAPSAGDGDSSVPESKLWPSITFSILQNEKGSKGPLVEVKCAGNVGIAPRLFLSGGQHGGFAPYFHVPWDRMDGAGVTKLSLIKLGNEVEVQLNGATQLWLPLDPEVEVKDLAFQVNIVGMTGTFYRMGLWRLE